jgi:hypothetical protein
MNKRALVIVTTGAMLAACGAQQSPLANGGIAQYSAIPQHRGHDRSWMLPEAKGDTLIYVSNQGRWDDGGVLVYSYPQGKQVGFLQPDTAEQYEGLCSDTHGNVWIVGWIQNGQAFLDEYAHGGTQPIDSIIATGMPSSCSVDPSTGNLAIANYVDIAVYQDAQGSPTNYYDSSITYYYYCTYDDKGDLFANGDTGYVNELPRGSSTLRHIYFDKRIAAGSLQWDKGDLAVTILGGAKGPTHVDRVTIAGSGAHIIGTTSLQTYKNEGTYLDVEFWIQGKTIAGPGAGSGGPTRRLYLWPYPAGGKAFKTIAAPDNSNFDGVTISVAQ